MIYKNRIVGIRNFLFIATFFVVAFLFAQTSWAEESTKEDKPSVASRFYGMVDEVADSIKAKASAMVSYDVATNEGALNSPESVAILSCFNQSIKTNTTVTGSLFSAGFNKASADKVLKEDYERYLRAFKDADQLKTGDFISGVDTSEGLEGALKDFTDIEAKAGFEIEASISVGPDNSGPKVKGVKCDQMNKLWERKRNEDAKSFPTAVQAIENLLSGKPLNDDTPGGEKFSAVWGGDEENKERLLEAEKKLKESSIKYADPDFSGEEDPCEVLNKQGAAVDCDANRRNTKKK